MKELTNLLGTEMRGLNGQITIPQTTLKINEMAFVIGEYWASVGVGCDYEISDGQILSFIKSEKKYRDPGRAMSGMPGGDSAKMMLIFKAVKPGSVILKIHKVFRGNKEGTKLIRIIIE